MSLNVIMKCTAVIRQLAYGTTPDAFDEYLQMSGRTAHDCLFHFNKCIISLYMVEYLRKPMLKDVENIYNKHLTTHGFPRMLESIDSRANNDINVLDNSRLFDDLLNDKATVAPYVVNGVEFENEYYLADGARKDVERALHTKLGWAREKLSKDVERDLHTRSYRKLSNVLYIQDGARKDVERCRTVANVERALRKDIASRLIVKRLS
nr:reverse transcriptase domain-containing protein [Tanacetum cinerariifolium]